MLLSWLLLFLFVPCHYRNPVAEMVQKLPPHRALVIRAIEQRVFSHEISVLMLGVLEVLILICTWEEWCDLGLGLWTVEDFFDQRRLIRSSRWIESLRGEGRTASFAVGTRTLHKGKLIQTDSKRGLWASDDQDDDDQLCHATTWVLWSGWAVRNW